MKARAWFVILVGVTALATVGIAIASIPQAQWSEWLYGNRFRFFGHEFEGPGVVFVVDRSGSNPKLGEARTEILEFLKATPSHFQLGVVSLDRSVVTFPPTGHMIRVTQENRTEAIRFAEGLRGGAGSALQKGFLAALEMARSLETENCAVVYVGDVVGGSDGVTINVEYLERLVSEFYDAAPVGTVLHGVDTRPNTATGRAFRRLIASRGGTYVAAR